MTQAIGGVGLGEVVESVLGSTEDGIFVLNRAEEVVVFNRACERLTGLRRDEVLGGRLTCDEVFRCHRFVERAPAGDAAAAGGAAPPRAAQPAPLPMAHVAAEAGPCALFDIFRERKERAREEILLVSRTGERHWVETSFSPVIDEGGAVSYTVGVLRIVDDRKRAEGALHQKNLELSRALEELRQRTRELLHAEKMSSLGQIAAGVAHELNTPLNTILGYSQLIAKRATDPEVAEEARAVEQATKRCRDIVRGLLDFSRKSDGFRAPRRLNKVIGRAFGFLKHDLDRRGVRAALELDRAPLEVLADENQLEQAFLNLASNALDAMPSGGTITVRTAASADRARVEIRFSDTGAGMTPDVLARAFEPFFTTKTTGRGTGLGLPIVERIVEEHGGTIEARSEPGAGAEFRIVLPLHQGPPSPQSGERPGASSAGREREAAR
jgi:signal transduction histidine kinase